MNFAKSLGIPFFTEQLRTTASVPLPHVSAFSPVLRVAFYLSEEATKNITSSKFSISDLKSFFHNEFESNAVYNKC